MRSTISEKHNYLIVSAVLIIATYFIRLWGLTSTSLWYDEVFVITHAQQGPVSAVIGLLQEDNALPLHGLLTALWVMFAGSHEFSARYLSVLLGTVTAPLMIRFSGTLTQTRYGGYGSALAYATLPIFVYYTQEVRMYALAIPLAATFSWLAFRLFKTGKNASLYPIIGLLMLVAHIYTSLLWAVFLAWGFINYIHRQPDQDNFTTWLRANAFMALGSIPIAVWAIWRVNTDATATSAIPFDVVRWIPTVFGIGQYISSPWKEIFTFITVISLCIGYIKLIRNHNFIGAVWIILSLLLPILLLICTTLVKAKWSERYLLPSFGLGLATSVGLGWDIQNDSNKMLTQHPWHTMGQRIVTIYLVVFWLAGSLPALNRQAEGSHALAIQDEWHPRPDFRGVAKYIEEYDSPEDAVVVVAGYAAHTLDYYYDGPAEITGLPLNTRVLNTYDMVDLNTLRILEEATLGNNTLWLILWQQQLSDPTNLIESILVASCNRLPVNASFANIGVLHFDLNGCRPLDQALTPPISRKIEYSVPIQLMGYDVQKQQGLWEVDLWWESTGRIENNFLVFVHLVNPAGEIIAQHDHIAGADAYPTSQWREGTYLRDRFFLEVPEDDCESCELQIGLYTNENRLDLKNGKDTIVFQINQ